MKVETFLSALEGAIDSEHNCVLVGNRLSDNPDTNRHEKLIADRMFAKADRRIRQINTFKARLLSMYSLDAIRRLEQSRDHWQRRAYLVEQENRDLRERLEDLENARLRTALDEMGQARIRYTRG